MGGISPTAVHSTKARCNATRLGRQRFHSKSPLQNDKIGPRLAKRPCKRTCGREQRAQIQNSTFRIQNYKFGLQPAEVAQVQSRTAGHDLRGARSYSLSFGAQPAEGAHDCKELRASAAPRLRPANRCAIDFAGKHFNRNGHRFLTEACPQPSGGLARADLRDASCSPPPGGGCGLPIASRSILTQDIPQQTAPAGCRSLRDRFCQQAFRSQLRLRAADRCAIEFAAKPFPQKPAVAGCRHLRCRE